MPVLACLAEDLGIRGTARVFEVDPNTVLQWLVEAAEQAAGVFTVFPAMSMLSQVQLDELYAVLREVKDGELSEEEAIKRLERSPHWVRSSSWRTSRCNSMSSMRCSVRSKTANSARRPSNALTLTPLGTVFVVADQVVGATLPRHIRHGCRRLAELSHTALLGVEFATSSAGPWTFAGATPMPDLRLGGEALLDALASALRGKQELQP